MEDISIKTGGQFMLCKDANDFRKKMKYFAPLLRFMLPKIASEDSYGDK